MISILYFSLVVSSMGLVFSMRPPVPGARRLLAGPAGVHEGIEGVRPF